LENLGAIVNRTTFFCFYSHSNLSKCRTSSNPNFFDPAKETAMNLFINRIRTHMFELHLFRDKLCGIKENVKFQLLSLDP